MAPPLNTNINTQPAATIAEIPAPLHASRSLSLALLSCPIHISDPNPVFVLLK